MRGRLLKRFIPTRSGGDISDDGCGAAWGGSSRLRLVPPEKAYCILRNKVGARAAMTTMWARATTTSLAAAAPRARKGVKRILPQSLGSQPAVIRSEGHHHPPQGLRAAV